MIKGFERIEVTKASYPFASAERYLHISEQGYEESEYYMEGLANVYGSGKEGTPYVKHKDVPYTNRIIVRAPKDPAKCSGHVFVEIINPTSRMEIDRMWILGYREFMRSGDIYVGITSKPATFGKLWEFNKERYGRIHWKNPDEHVPFPFSEEDVLKCGGMNDQDIHNEMGLFWDMLTDLGALLKENGAMSPLHEYPITYVSLTGWSQSGSYMLTYLNRFIYTKAIKEAFDGYLLGAPVRYCYIPLNQYETCDGDKWPMDRELHEALKPTIIFQTESENGQFGSGGLRRRNGYESNYMVREYDITGSSHDTQETYVTYYQEDEDLKRIHHLPHYAGKNAVANNYPLYFAFDAGFRNLKYWLESGVAPSTCSLIELDENYGNKKDAFGNSIGGLRTCLLDYPLGTYYNYSNIERGANALFPDSDKEVLFGHEEPFSKELLKELYGNLDTYKALITEHTKTQIMKGFICQEDGDELVKFALKLAKERGL